MDSSGFSPARSPRPIGALKNGDYLGHCRTSGGWCYRPFEPAPDGGPLPALSNGHVTFGNLSNLIRMSDGAVAREWRGNGAEG